MKSRKRANVIWKIFAEVIIFLLLLLTYSLVWGKKNFGNIGFEEIVFTLNMPLKGTSESILTGYMIEALFPALIMFFVSMIIVFWPAKKNYHLVLSIADKKWNIWVLPIAVHVIPFLVLTIIWGGASGVGCRPIVCDGGICGESDKTIKDD